MSQYHHNMQSIEVHLAPPCTKDAVYKMAVTIVIHVTTISTLSNFKHLYEFNMHVHLA